MKNKKLVTYLHVLKDVSFYEHGFQSTGINLSNFQNSHML